MRDKELYDQVALELSNNAVDPGTWAKAYADALGDEEKARARYIKLRVKQLSEARVKARRSTDAGQDDATGKSRISGSPSRARSVWNTSVGSVYIPLGLLFLIWGLTYGNKGGSDAGAVALIVVGGLFVIGGIKLIRK